MSTPAPVPTLGEEIAHAVTHGIGALLALLGLVLLVVTALHERTPLHAIGCGVYGGTLLTLYVASTVYHAVPARLVRAKRVAQRFDHAAIYLLIAGTYTPFTLLALADPWGLRLFSIIWGLATIGLFITARSLLQAQTPDVMKSYERASLALYLLMGWLGVLAAKPLLDALPWTPIALLVGGGVAYTLGVAFFVQQRKWAHSIWHGFVLAGSGLHFLAVWSLLSP